MKKKFKITAKTKSIIFGLLSITAVQKLFIKATPIMMGGIIFSNSLKGQQAFVAQTTVVDSSWRVFRQFTPGNTPGNSENAIYLDRYKLDFNSSVINFSAVTKNAGDIIGPLVWFNGNRIVSSPISSAIFSISNVTSLQTALNAKYDIPSGTISQYIRGDGSLLTFPTIPAQYSLTEGSGISLTGTYPSQTISNTGIITEVDPTVSSAAKSISGSDITNWNGKYNSPTGSISQYIRGDGSLLTFPTIPTQYNLTQGTGISITGTYPNQTITNTGIITEVDPTVSSSAKSISGSDITNWNGKYNSPTGSISQYIRGDGSLLTFPTIPTQYSLTQGSGISLTGTYPSQTISNTGIITEVDPTVSSSAKSISESDITNWNGKYNSPAGTISQYIRGDGSLLTFPTIPAQYSLTQGTGISITGTYPNQTITNTSVNITPTLTAGNSTSITTNGNSFTVAALTQTINTPNRTLNVTYTVNTTNDAKLFYTIRITYNITVLLGSIGGATLQTSPDAITWTSWGAVSNNLNLGLALSGYNDFQLTGEALKGQSVQIITSSTNATVTIRPEQKELLH